jgi:hypothetical protein
MTHMGEAAIFLAVSFSGYLIYQTLKTIAEHLWQIRLLCAGIDARYKMESDTRAWRSLAARETREASGE